VLKAAPFACHNDTLVRAGFITHDLMGKKPMRMLLAIATLAVLAVLIGTTTITFAVTAPQAGQATAQDALDSIGVPADQLRSVVPA